MEGIMAYLYDWKVIAGIMGVVVVIYLVSMLVHLRAKKTHGHLINDDTYATQDVLAHKGQNRVYLPRDDKGQLRAPKSGTHPQFGPLMEQVGARIFKNFAIALFFFAFFAYALYLTTLSEEPLRFVDEGILSQGWVYWAAISLFVLYALYRLYLATSYINLYRGGMVIGTLLTKREIDYNDIAQVGGFETVTQRQVRGDSWFRNRRTWAMSVMLKSGKVLDLSDLRYARAFSKLTRWQDCLEWEGEPHTFQPQAEIV